MNQVIRFRWLPIFLVLGSMIGHLLMVPMSNIADSNVQTRIALYLGVAFFALIIFAVLLNEMGFWTTILMNAGYIVSPFLLWSLHVYLTSKKMEQDNA